jgi:hypothetical protein
MQISVSELRKISDMLFTHLENGGRHTIEVRHDYYWFVPAEHRYHPYQEPTGLRLGQVTDDWKQLQKIIRRESEPTSYALVWLSSLLSAVGEPTPK